MFKRLRIEDWHQFEDVDIEFHDRLTVLTGANGSGKTTILDILSTRLGRRSGYKHYSRHLPKAQVPVGTLSEAENANEHEIFEAKHSKLHSAIEIPAAHTVNGLRVPSGVQTQEPDRPISLLRMMLISIISGFFVSAPILGYSLYKKTLHIETLSIDDNVVPGLFLLWMIIVFGLFLLFGHRPLMRMLRVEQAPYYYVSPAIQEFHLLHLYSSSNYFTRCVLQSPLLQRFRDTSVSISFLQDLAQLSKRHEELTSTFFEKTKRVLPAEFNIAELSRVGNELHATAGDGTTRHAGELSHGTSSLLALVWSLCIESLDDERFVVLIDEPENHLHPGVQRELFTRLVEEFPKAQFIVGTHSPFFIGAVENSIVYALRFNDDQKVVSKKLDFINKAGTANDILREALGVDFSRPVWAEKLYMELLDDYDYDSLTKEQLRELKDRLKRYDMVHLLPDAVVELRERRDDKNSQNNDDKDKQA